MTQNGAAALQRACDAVPGRAPTIAAKDLVAPVLVRELGIREDDLDEVTAINDVAWAVDSSFSSQTFT